MVRTTHRGDGGSGAIETQRTLLAAGLMLALGVSDARASIPLRDGSGQLLFRDDPRLTVVFNSRNPAFQHDAWRAAMLTITTTGGTSLAIEEHPNSPTPAEPQIGDGVNTVALMDGNGWAFYSPEDPYTVVKCVAASGEVVEDDVFFNALDFKLETGLNGSYVHERYLDMESVALSAFLEGAANLDRSVRYVQSRFVELPNGEWKRQPAAAEAAALRALYPDGSINEATIGGRVTKNTEPVAYAYVCASGRAEGDEFCALTDETGAYTIRHVETGSYRVAVVPTTTSPSFLISQPYRANEPSNVNFQALAAPAPVTVAPGQTIGGIDFAVSDTASAPEPGESLEPLDLPADGSPVLFNTWPVGDEDRGSLTTLPGQCWVYGTTRTGVAAAAASDELAVTKTYVRLFDGSTALSESGSRNIIQDDPRSLGVFCEGPDSRELELAVVQRQPGVAGAGHYFDLFAKAIQAREDPAISGVDPSAAVSGTETFLVVKGQGFLPGAEIVVGQQPATLEAVADCDGDFVCATIMAATPANLPPGLHDVTAINPDGGTATLSHGFQALAPPAGPVYDMFWWGTWPFPATLSEASGLCWGDYDGDGDHDLFRAGDTGFLLLRYDGDSSFSDVSGTNGIPGFDPLNPMYSCAWGDIEGDGDLDLYVTMEPVAASDEDRLYVNQLSETGAATFIEEAGTRGITQPSGDILTKPVFLDHDHDGDLDIFVAAVLWANGIPQEPNRLYRNSGNGSFTDVAAGAGVDMGLTKHRTVDAIVGDFSGDGWDDLYLVNLPVPGGHDGSDALFFNDRSGGFVNVSLSAGIDSIDNCNNGQAADFNHDGRLDIACFLSSKAGDPPARLYLNEGNGTFADIAVAAGLTSPPLPQRWCSSMALLDRDLDGDTDIYLGCRPEPFTPGPADHLDLLLSNQFVETGLVTFSDVTQSSGLSSSGNYDLRTDVVTALDFDGDFDADIFKSGDPGYDLIWGGLQNNPGFPDDLAVEMTRDAIKVRLSGTLSNPHGIGARITAIRDLGLPAGVEPTREACLAPPPPGESATGFVLADGHNQGPYELLLAFGPPNAPRYAGSVDCLIVRWPSGYAQVHTSLPMQASLNLVETSESVAVVSVTPDQGPQSGGEPVTIQGFAFEPGAEAFFGMYAAENCVTQDSNTLHCSTPRWQPLDTVDVIVVNPDLSSGILTAAYTFVGSLEIEVVDPNPDLMAGAAVSSSADILSRPWARPVVGLAADGATRVLLRVQVAGAGDEVTFRLRNQNGVLVQPHWGYGTLVDPAAPAGDDTELTVTARPAANGTWWAFAVLRAPRDSRAIDVVIQDSPPLFGVGKTEPMFIEAEYCAGASCPAGSGQIVARQFELFRPPIALLGGAYSDETLYGWDGGWLPFYLFPGLLELDDVFYLFRGNFSGISDRHLSEIATYWDDAIVDGAIRGMRFTEQIAVTRAFVIAHSAGAAATRLYIGGQGDLPYLRDDNFMQGDIAGFVSLVGMHTGSVVSQRIWDLVTGSPAGVVAAIDYFADTIGLPVDNGIIEDSGYDSPVVRNLPGSSLDVPVHAMWASGATGLQTNFLWNVATHRIRYPVKLLDHFSNDLNDLLLGQCQHDGVLFALSQIGQLNYPGPLDSEDLTELEFSSFPGPPVWSFHWTVTDEWPASDALVRLLTDKIYGPTAHDPEWCFWDPDNNSFCKGFPDNQLLPESAFSGCDPLARAGPPAPARAAATSPVREEPVAPASPARGLTIVHPPDGTHVPPGQTFTVEVAATGGYEPDRVSVIASTGEYATDTDGPPYSFELTIPEAALGIVTVGATALRVGNSDLHSAPTVKIVVDMGGIGLAGLAVMPRTMILSPTSSYSRVAIHGEYTDGVGRRVDPATPGVSYASANPAVATVTPDGFVSGHGFGNAEITVSYGGRSATLTVVVADVRLALALDADSITWPARAHAVGYDILTGDLGLLRDTGGDFGAAVSACLGDDVAETEIGHAAIPAPGQGFFYLVRPVVSAENVGSYDVEGKSGQFGDRDAPIAASAARCL